MPAIGPKEHHWCGMRDGGYFLLVLLYSSPLLIKLSKERRWIRELMTQLRLLYDVDEVSWHRRPSNLFWFSHRHLISESLLRYLWVVASRVPSETMPYHLTNESYQDAKRGPALLEGSSTLYVKLIFANLWSCGTRVFRYDQKINEGHIPRLKDLWGTHFGEAKNVSSTNSYGGQFQRTFHVGDRPQKLPKNVSRRRTITPPDQIFAEASLFLIKFRAEVKAKIINNIKYNISIVHSQ